MKEIKMKITTEQIGALLEGKKLTIERMGEYRVEIFPERYGVFMTMEKFAELRRKIAMQTLVNPEDIFTELFGEDMTKTMFG